MGGMKMDMEAILQAQSMREQARREIDEELDMVNQARWATAAELDQEFLAEIRAEQHRASEETLQRKASEEALQGEKGSNSEPTTTPGQDETALEVSTPVAEAGLKEEVNDPIQEAPPTNEVDDRVSMLIEMGFTDEDVALALKKTQGSLERAADWLFVTRQEAQEEASGEPFPEEWEDMLGELCEMGFQEAAAMEALKESEGNLKQAVRSLVTAERAANLKVTQATPK